MRLRLTFVMAFIEMAVLIAAVTIVFGQANFYLAMMVLIVAAILVLGMRFVASRFYK